MSIESIDWNQVGNGAAVIAAVAGVTLVILHLLEIIARQRGEPGEGADDAARLLYRLASRVKSEPAVVAGLVSAAGVFLVQAGVIGDWNEAWADRISVGIVAAAGFVIRLYVTPVGKVERSGFKFSKDADKWKRQR